MEFFSIMFKSVLISSLFLVTGNFSMVSLSISKAQNPPAETYQPGFWQPVGRVEVDQLITLKLINDTELIIDYAITNENMEPVSIKPNSTMILEDIEPSLYVVIYPDSNSPNSSQVYLKHNVEVTEENVIEVTIQKTENGSESHRTFNLQETGAIYLY